MMTMNLHHIIYKYIFYINNIDLMSVHGMHVFCHQITVKTSQEKFFDGMITDLTYGLMEIGSTCSEILFCHILVVTSVTYPIYWHNIVYLCAVLFICEARTTEYSRTSFILPSSESYWCGRIRGMVVREGLDY